MTTENFITYDYENPSEKFTQKDIDFMENLDENFTPEDRRIIRSLEYGRFNLNTGMASFQVIPGIRPVSNQGCLYFSRFSKKSFNSMMNDFFLFHQDRLEDSDRYKAICEPYRIITPKNDIFYPIVYWGELKKKESLYSESAKFFGSKLAYFEEAEFVVGVERFRFSQLAIEVAQGAKLPKKW